MEIYETGVLTESQKKSFISFVQDIIGTELEDNDDTVMVFDLYTSEVKQCRDAELQILGIGA